MEFCGVFYCQLEVDLVLNIKSRKHPNVNNSNVQKYPCFVMSYGNCDRYTYKIIDIGEKRAKLPNVGYGTFSLLKDGRTLTFVIFFVFTLLFTVH